MARGGGTMGMRGGAGLTHPAQKLEGGLNPHEPTRRDEPPFFLELFETLGGPTDAAILLLLLHTTALSTSSTPRSNR